MAEGELKPLLRLTDAQMDAVEPTRNVWLSASAGSGKTQVLSARVIRLLLQTDVRPENLLCLTFTKAAAAEMADRINRRLAAWVQMKGPLLAEELQAIGANFTPQDQANARQLFAKVLDAPGGGLQIMTIHSFCQSLLASFSEEAGIVPGFEPIEGRGQEELLNDALMQMLEKAALPRLEWISENLQALSIEMGEDGAIGFLRRCALQSGALLAVPPDQGCLAIARRAAGLPDDFSMETLSHSCSDAVIDRTELEHLADMNTAWGAATGLKRAAAIANWLALDDQERATSIDVLHYCFAKRDGDAQHVTKGTVPQDENYSHLALDAYHWTRQIMVQSVLANYAERYGRALQLGRAYAECYTNAKHERGVVDFDDMIRKAADLLSRPGISDWVRYKLDRKIDHILIDESQDTNDAQWRIVNALSDDFFSGSGAKSEEKSRTLFTVGDFKQAIYGFQGTDPEKYEDAFGSFDAKIKAAGGTLHDLTLARSFRSTKPVLDFVNSTIATAEHATFGIKRPIAMHRSELPDAGSVELLRCVEAMDIDPEVVDAEEDWITSDKLKLANLIAHRIKDLVDDEPILSSTGKPLVPGDIMVLLRRRNEFATLLVARLHALGVPVAGIDRLELSASLAVQDLLAAVRFVLQPFDDLSLASVLVSPLIGWSQEKLLQYGYREKGVALWSHLRGQAEIVADIAPLRSILGMVDFIGPYQFLENILSGPMRGRDRLSARLGTEVLVPIEELLNLVLSFEQQGGNSLQAFLNWFESDEGTIKREGLAQSNDVRILTIHGAKGLEAPVVILADCTIDPLKIGGKKGGPDLLMDGDARLPMLLIKKNEQHGTLAEAVELAQSRELAEHYRLFYVAMTRAEEHLILAGGLGKRAKDGLAPDNSWYALAERAMLAMGVSWQNEPVWGGHMLHRGSEAPVLKSSDAAALKQKTQPVEPAWLRSSAPQELRPPRPLSPSNLGDDDYGDAPALAAMQMAAERGRLIHGLFERYHGQKFDAFVPFATMWLQREARVSGIDLDAVIQTFLSVVTRNEWQHLFGADARSEVPLAALVGETVITGRIDRLLVTPEFVDIVDFKTGRNIPKSVQDIPVAHLRQMAHYVAAVETIFPGRAVRASLLFSYAPILLEIPAHDLAQHKPTMAD